MQFHFENNKINLYFDIEGNVLKLFNIYSQNTPREVMVDPGIVGPLYHKKRNKNFQWIIFYSFFKKLYV